MALVVGPMEPATKRGRAPVENSAAAWRASLRRAEVQVVRLRFEPVFGQHQRGAAEGVGLDHVGAGLEVRAMDAEHDVGPRANQVFVAAFQSGAAEVGGGQPALLEHGAHGPIEDEDTLLQDFSERPLTLFGCGHRSALIQS